MKAADLRKPLSRAQKDVVAATPGLSSYLSSLADGRPATPHSWLYENQSSDATLAQWREILTAGLAKFGSVGKATLQFDERQLVKFGPQGQIPPINEALDTLDEQYDSGIPSPVFRTTRWESAKKEAAELLFGHCFKALRPLRFEDVVDDMRERDTLSTNSGYPLFTRRKNPEVIKASIADAESGKAYDYPAIILFRQYNKKLRPVWMYPMALNLIESSYAQVLQDAIRKSNPAFVSPWVGFEQVKRTLSSWWTPGKLAYGGDVSAMDAHFKAAQMKQVFDVVKYAFQEQYWEALERSMLAVTNIEILVGQDAAIPAMPHGIASGSGWTQICETVFQYIMHVYLNKHAGNSHFMGFRSRNHAMAIGDDSVYVFESLSSRAAEMTDFFISCGLPANVEKQSDDRDKVTFLQRMFLRGWMSRENSHVLGGIYPTIRALNSSLNPERFHNPKDWNSDMFCVRQYMILENTVDHPLFQDFVQFVCKGQKDLIPFAKKSPDELQQHLAKSRTLPGFNPTYNQEKLFKPLSSFESIKLAKGM